MLRGGCEGFGGGDSEYILSIRQITMVSVKEWEFWVIFMEGPKKSKSFILDIFEGVLWVGVSFGLFDGALRDRGHLFKKSTTSLHQRSR